ncbi:hypothetical protein PACTADRAFT_50541 [Pachysolen tannophilus NRRL Y-2460]|uniref:non-specific serine/threonine protein kinase n=1 Tax=Pachysolen tannophilus NRRL Y-2460 TaxID=669874 RepID=A0A1E4TSF4_PACTA|nr:hypothetical protein PACTADRAFT_50541 [Pachysolen tannophilus NRRL Y-2460]
MNFFKSSSKTHLQLDDVENLSRNMESFEISTPTRNQNKSFMSTGNDSFTFECSPAGNNIKRNSAAVGDNSFLQQPMRFLERINNSTLNKENTPLSSNLQLQPSSPPKTTRLTRDFYNKANSANTKRLVTVAEMYFLDYYCDYFDYIINRRNRLRQVESNLNQLNDQQQRNINWKNYVGRERALLRKRRIKPKNKDFDLITQVGQGGYGQVYLAKKKDTREIVALKILSKKLLMKLDETRHVLTERDILTNTRSEWLVKLLYAFQNTDSLFLAMEFVPGGDYRTLLNNTGVLIPPHARFYLSEMFASVNALHELGYTHRDLKPENFLIDSKGHIKLTDFGLAAGTVSTERIESMKLRLNQVKDLEYRPKERTISERQNLYRSLRAKDVHLANSIVGSPDYMALEVLEGRPYDYTIDYWSLGCMLFETLVGYPPFSGASPDETYHNLRRWKEVLKRPRYEDGKYVFSDRTWNFIIKLIASPSSRYRNFNQIINSQYFQEVDFNNLRDRVAPFTPQLDDDEDAGYFDDFSNEKDMEKYKEVMLKKEQVEKMADRRNAKNNDFVGFTFKHKENPNNNTSGILMPIINFNNIDDKNFNNQVYLGSRNRQLYNDPFSTLY